MDPRMLERLTIRPASLLRSKGRNACVVAMSPNKFVSKVFRQVSRLFAHFLVFVVEHHPGVIDKNIESPEVALNLSSGLANALGAVDVELQGTGLDSLFAKTVGGRFAFLQITRADEHDDVFLPQLPGCFQADAFVSSGDYRDLFVVHSIIVYLVVNK